MMNTKANPVFLVKQPNEPCAKGMSKAIVDADMKATIEKGHGTPGPLSLPTQARVGGSRLGSFQHVHY
jgi:hypothetical protein